MGLRTIEAPGVEIKEIDKSGYTPSMTGSKCFVMGYSDKGTPYEPMQFTSKAAWQNFYGDPDNEAERYFYNACSEVINQNGVLYCARIPYDNESLGKMNAFTFKVNPAVKDFVASSQAIASIPLSGLKNNENFEKDTIKFVINNKFQRHDEMEKHGEEDQELKDFYNAVLNANEIDGSKNQYSVEYYQKNVLSGISKTFQTQHEATEFRKSIVTFERGNYLIDNIKVEKITTTGKTGDWKVTADWYGFKVYRFDETTRKEITKEVAETKAASLKEDENNKNVEVVKSGFDTEWIISSAVSSLNEKFHNETDSIYKDLYEEWKPMTILQIGKYEDENAMFQDFKENGNISLDDIKNRYSYTGELEARWHSIGDADSNIKKYIEINPSNDVLTAEQEKIDEYRTGESFVEADSILIVDKTCGTLNSIAEDTRKGKDRQLLGIFPVITTAANAIYAQSMINTTSDETVDYETVTGSFVRKYDGQTVANELLSTDLVKQFNNATRNIDGTVRTNTVSLEANTYFSPIQMDPTGEHFDKENLKKIGVVVFKAFMDASEGNKVNFTAVEAFIGSLGRNDRNPNTGASTFIDNIVNTQSEYIYLFSNCFNNTTKKANLDKADILILNPSKTGMLGFFADETAEEHTLSSIYDGIEKCFRKVEDINERDIDIVCDAGLANIAQFMQSTKDAFGPKHAYDIDMELEGQTVTRLWKCSSSTDVEAWKTVLFKYDNFCKNTRKDCMFIADAPRPLVLQGQKKIVRTSKPSNTIDANILPNVKYVTGINTNYGAGYMDWFKVADEFTGDNFWCPPSIKAMGVYINTDLNFNYWDAPAGLNRGMIQALDCAFSPTIKQAGSIYQKNWNYAINYPNDGIVLEGQKTFQVKPSAFDRVNVRRLFLRLERQTYKVARYFVYEGNTAYTRQRLIDMLDPLFYTAKVGGGIYDYKIICDESINTPTVIDNNELRVKIGIKPVKTAEFILIDFIALATGGSFSEM